MQRIFNLKNHLMDTEYQYDFFVIGNAWDLCGLGGGSGGLAAAKTAGKLGAKTGLADFVKPTPLGT
jgi:thioredoxin reductase (NADPH)